jgi:hypothetical protein
MRTPVHFRIKFADEQKFLKIIESQGLVAKNIGLYSDFTLDICTATIFEVNVSKYELLYLRLAVKSGEYMEIEPQQEQMSVTPQMA